MKLITLLLFISFSALAQIHNVELSGPTSESVAIHDAEKLVLKKLVTNKGMNGEEYLKKITERFFTRYESFKARKMQEAYGSNYQATMTPEQKESIDARFDRETAEYYKRYLGLDIVFDSKVSEKFPENKWKIAVTEKPGAFDSWYNRFENSNSKVKFLVIPHIELVNYEWSEFKLSDETPFVNALWSAWLKGLQENNSAVNLSLCTDQCERQWNIDKKAENSNLGVYFGQEDEVLLVVELRIELKKLKMLPNGEVENQISASYSLHDYSSRSLLEAMSMGPELKRIQSKDDPQITNSVFANHLYRISLPAFTRLKSFNDFRPYNQVQQLVIEGQKNLLEVKDLEGQLKLATNSFFPRWELFYLSRSTVSFKILYRGEEKSFKELITNLQQLKSSYNAQCVWDSNSKELKLKLIHE